MNKRAIPEDLLSWALACLGMEQVEASWSVVAGDASQRCYFRLLLPGATYILVVSPPATEKNAEFLAVREMLERAGLTVPALVAADLERGYLVLGDLGDRLLQGELTEESVDGSYRTAFDVLLRMGSIDPGDPGWPAYDRPLLAEELSRFPQWFVEGLLDLPWGAAEDEVWRPFGDTLIDNALQQPRVLVHRDFHSRNLMPQPGGELGIIDFQDAVVGHLTYDLVSLLRDCYVQWPPDRVQAWALAYLRLARQAGRLGEITEEKFMTWFDLSGLQRHIKVLGTFARLYLRDGKPAYLADLPLVIHYVREILEKYAPVMPSVGAFAGWFERTLLPSIAAQPWSRSA